MIEQFIPAKRAGQLFSAISESEYLFVHANGTLGFGFLVYPMAGFDENTEIGLRVLLRQEWPPNTIVQISLFGSPAISTDLDQMRAMRSGTQEPLLQRLTEERGRFLAAATGRPIDPFLEVMVRNVRLAITVKMPIAGGLPTPDEIEGAQTFRVRIKQGLETLHLYSVYGYEHGLDAAGYLSMLGPLLNYGASATWRSALPVDVEDDVPLRDQILDFDAAVQVTADSIVIGRTHVGVLSPKLLPRRAQFGHAIAMMGDMVGGARGMRYPFLISATLLFPDRAKEKARHQRASHWVTQQAFGPLLKFIPTLAAKKEDFDALFGAYEDGDRPIRFAMTAVLFAPDDKALSAAMSEAEVYWGELGFHLIPDRFVALPLLLNAIPMNADWQALDTLRRHKSMATRHAAPLIPLFGEWGGTGTPTMNFVSRNGQLQNVCLFDSPTNFNLFVAAESGSGKSFLANYLLTSYLSLGAQAWVIDVGRSYEKLCEHLGGEFIHFGPGSTVCLNPFPLVQDIDDEEDVLIGLLSAMAFPTEEPTDLQTQGMKQALRASWEEKGRDTTIDTIESLLLEDDDQRIRDIGRQLFSFTSRGQYGRYFQGGTPITFRNKFTVLELEELKGRKHLQNVVLSQIIYQIQQVMYLGFSKDRGTKRLVLLDEAWDLLGQEGGTAKFIEHAYRRFRKYNGAAITITQSVEDLMGNVVGKAIFANSANMFLLAQKAQAIEAARRDNLLGLSDGGYEQMKTVHTKRGVYSEVFFMTKRGAGIGRLIVTPFERLLYSTHPDDTAAIAARMAGGMDLDEAIVAILHERGQKNAA